MPKCTINGKEVEVAPGSTIIQAFQKCDEAIAHYCWHPGLSIAGVCRMCVVDIEGQPRPQIACNTVVTEGMKISNTSERIRDAVKWVLEFHLINHPLDCPICDQAGECGLQEYYMKHGTYEPQMGERKVKKQKVISLGDKVVLDQERCILCSRCVRFTDEVTKTGELGIFNRGDHAEVATHDNKPLNNNYSVNVVDICPVGALTSKDFRFRQRVWFLKEFDSVCTGCSTGCATKVHYNENGLYRIKPVYDADVNGHWMCDVGRDAYKHINKEFRVVSAVNGKNPSQKIQPGQAAIQLGQELQKLSGQVGLVLTAQHTNEELKALTSFFADKLGAKQKITVWADQSEKFQEFDGLLFRGDRNPNTAGLQKVLGEAGVTKESHAKDWISAPGTWNGKALDKAWEQMVQDVKSKSLKVLVIAAPENLSVYPTADQKIDQLIELQKETGVQVVWLGAANHARLKELAWVIPLKSYVEKDGTFLNFKGIERKIKKGAVIVSQALTLTEVATLFAGQPLTVTMPGAQLGAAKEKIALGAY